MPKTSAYAAPAARKPLGPFTIDRRQPGPRDVHIDILFCGVCHSDLHQVRSEWGGEVFPMVPGHEIAGLEQFCEKGAAFTYNSTEMDRKTPTYGGYSRQVVVAEPYVLKVPAALDPARAAPLLCAGITTYSPLRQWKTKKGDRVGVVGLGGLGHMGVKLAASMGADVTVLSTSRSKEPDARKLGAHAFEVTKDPATFQKLAGRFDVIIDTISAPHDYNAYLGMLRPRGAMVVVGIPPEPTPVGAASLIQGNKVLAGSMIGGIPETQEMLDYCAAHEVAADVEVIPIQEINEAYERMLRGDVRYRFVIDIGSLP